jgi:hypothetical protein
MEGFHCVANGLEHDPQKWNPLLRQDHAQAFDLAHDPLAGVTHVAIASTACATFCP